MASSDKEMRIKVSVDNSDYVSKMKSMGQLQNNFGKSVTSTSQQLSKSDFGAAGATKATGAFGKLGKMWVSASTGMGTITAAATPMTAALAVGAKAIQKTGQYVVDSVKSYSTFEGTLKQVQIVAGGTQADMDLLGKKAMEIGSKTSKGAQEVAEAMVDFAKLGFTAQETADAMTGIVYAAEASGSSVDTTANIVAAALNTWSLAASDSEHIADVLSQTANQTAADMTDLGYTFQYAGASAQLGGASMEQLAAYTGIMADQGIKGSKAGTTLRTAFTNLTSPTNDAAEALENLGINLKDAEGNARPIPDVIGDLQDAAEGMSKADILDLSTALFGKTGAAGMSMVLQKTRDETNQLTDALVNSTGTATKQAAEMRQTLEGQLDQIGDSFDTLKLKIGKAFSPVALEGAKGLNSVLDGVDQMLDSTIANFEMFKTTADFGVVKQQFQGLKDSAGDFFDRISGSEGFQRVGQDIVTFGGQLAELGSKVIDFTAGDGGLLDWLDKIDSKWKDFNSKLQDNKVADFFNNMFGGGKSKEVDEYSTKLSKFADAIGAMNVNAREIQADPFSKLAMTDASKQMELVAATMDKLNAKAGEFALISPEQITAFTSATATIQQNLNTLTSQVAVENAKVRQDPNYNPTASLTATVNENMPALQSALQTQVDTVKAAGETQFNAIAASLQQQTTINEEAQGKILLAVQTGNQRRVAEQEARNQEILSLEQNLGNMTANERQNALSRIQQLEQQSNQQIIDQANLKSQAIVETFRAEAEASGSISSQAKATAIQNANEQRDATVQAAQDTYIQAVAAYQSMSDEQVAASGYSREQLIDNAYQTMVGTIQHANTMKTQTVSEIQGIQDKAEEADGTTITTHSKTSGFEETYNAIKRITMEDGRVVTIHTNIVNNANVGPVGPIPNERIGKARGGLATGVGYGVGSGSATYSSGTAFGRGNQLGQGGVGQGIVHNERGREVIMPVQNATYMRPFARAVANELANMGASSSSPQVIQVPVYLNTREIARATNEDMTAEQQRYTKTKNRAIGKV